MSKRRFTPDYQDDLDRYYQDELRYLKDLGKEHSEADATRSSFDFGAIEDPDVLCLLKGFSFLTARIRQTLDDGLPEISHSLLKLLFPHYLRPVPAMTVAEFRPQPGSVQSRTTLPRGTFLDAKPVDGEVCRFQTAFAVDVLPVEIQRFRLERGGGRGGSFRLTLAAVGPADLSKLDLSSIRVFLRDGAQEDRAATLLWLLCEFVAEMTIEWTTPEGRATARRDPGEHIRHVGFELGEFGEEETNLLPYPTRSFAGFRLLHEYFSLPSKFQFLDFSLCDSPGGLAFPGAEKLQTFDVVFRLDELPAGLPQIDEAMLALHCSPIVNLYPHDTAPLLLDHSSTEYVLRPRDGSRRRREIWSIERVMAVEPHRREIPDFFSFHSAVSAPEGSTIFYESRLRPAQFGLLEDVDEANDEHPTTDTFLRFVTADSQPAGGAVMRPSKEGLRSTLPPEEKLSIDVLCTDRLLPLRLKPADICVPSERMPLGIQFKGIEPITPNIAPPLGNLMHWRLLSHLALNRLSLTSPDTLRGILEIYDFHARSSPAALRESRRRLDAIRDIKTEVTTAFREGAAVRVVETILELESKGFKGTGDMYRFGAVLSHFFALYVAANCLSRLTIRVPSTGLELRYEARIGSEALA